MTLYDIIGAAMSLGVAALAGFVFLTTFYFGAVAVVETAGDVWRWAKAYQETRRRDREEMLEEWARKVAR